ncbi:MAG TPA: class I SAM-dependent methyltransferase [Terracidiphilus sp.]|nr:class I SAM-dependent methyltransferase [Terracidiphilus sp.]
MSCCPAANPTAYETGVLAASGQRLPHPGGAELTRHAIESAGLRAGARIVDLGAGAGKTVELLRTMGFDAVGVEPRADKPSAQTGLCVRATAESLPFPNGSATAVLAECSLSVMGDWERVLAECARVLERGGRLIVADLYARNPEAIGRARALGHSAIAGMIVREELQASLRAHGFAAELWEDHSRALREFAARFLMYNGSLTQLWGCAGTGASAQEIESAMKATRAGYFLLIATAGNAHRSTPPRSTQWI